MAVPPDPTTQTATWCGVLEHIHITPGASPMAARAGVELVAVDVRAANEAVALEPAPDVT